uniref:Uncharacterized protein n=1 Tax=Arion vulgaris TaxID=1028688 RepID=A0A0B7C4C5_9EUPU
MLNILQPKIVSTVLAFQSNQKAAQSKQSRNHSLLLPNPTSPSQQQLLFNYSIFD